MQAIKPYTQIYDDINKPLDIMKKIEVCGRVCYKSENKIEEGSAEKFVSNIIKRGHESVLEHGTFIFKVDADVYRTLKGIVEVLQESYTFKSFLRFTNDINHLVSGNVRAWRDFLKACDKNLYFIPTCMKKFLNENPILFPEFQSEPIDLISTSKFTQITTADFVTENEKLTHWDVTVKFVIDRGISHEVVRHRPASFSQESTRYCNYSKDDFGSEITFIIPSFLDYKCAGWSEWKNAMKNAETDYFKLLDIGLTAQEARSVLPNSLKTEVVMTTNLATWKHFFTVRTTNAAHPQMREVAKPLLVCMKELIPNVLDDITDQKG